MLVAHTDLQNTGGGARHVFTSGSTTLDETLAIECGSSRTI